MQFFSVWDPDYIKKIPVLSPEINITKSMAVLVLILRLINYSPLFSTKTIGMGVTEGRIKTHRGWRHVKEFGVPNVITSLILKITTYCLFLTTDNKETYLNLQTSIIKSFYI